ncbi:hypothetical protein LINGRAHAP2_LOCUS4445, partial [Linum grandiflorum]
VISPSTTDPNPLSRSPTSSSPAAGLPLVSNRPDHLRGRSHRRRSSGDSSWRRRN